MAQLSAQEKFYSTAAAGAAIIYEYLCSESPARPRERHSEAGQPPNPPLLPLSLTWPRLL